MTLYVWVKEEERVKQDVNGEWLCQTRFVYSNGYKTSWSTVHMAPTKEIAEEYFIDEPDWVRNWNGATV